MSKSWIWAFDMSRRRSVSFLPVRARSSSSPEFCPGAHSFLPPLTLSHSHCPLIKPLPAQSQPPPKAVWRSPPRSPPRHQVRRPNSSVPVSSRAQSTKREVRLFVVDGLGAGKGMSRGIGCEGVGMEVAVPVGVEVRRVGRSRRGERNCWRWERARVRSRLCMRQRW